MTAHTEGPWKLLDYSVEKGDFYGGEDGETVMLDGADGQPVLASQDYENYSSYIKMRSHADAKLIAAAPDLPQALKDLVTAQPASMMRESVTDDALEAIKKATQ